MAKLPSLSAGRGVSVVLPGPEHSFTLAEEALAELLLRDDVRDRPVVVISVAGAFRKGKSFLLDFFLRYLHHTYTLGKSGGDWLGSEDDPLQGFAWRGGSERETTGLLLWSQPFKATLPSGEKVVILLMDTQGTFDSESTVRDNATVFALSTMLSSTQIYNLSQNLEEDDLQHLQLFTDYGRLAADSSKGGKPFQKLQFLIRDWSYPYEYPYGADGGEKLLKKRLEVHSGQHEQLQALREHIASCFEELSCFLLPHPGMRVATDPEFTGKLSDIDTDFKSHLRQLVPLLLSPASLVPKRIEGERVLAKNLLLYFKPFIMPYISPNLITFLPDIDTDFKSHLRQLVPLLLSPGSLVPKRIEGERVLAKNLLLYFKAYMNVFNGSELPEPKSILAATAEANNLSAVAAAKDVYDSLMDEKCGGSYLEPSRVRQEHARALDKALHRFHSSRKMGGDELSLTYCQQLTKELEDQLATYLERNEAKNIFKFIGTPAVLGCLVVLGYLVSLLGSTLGVQTLVSTGAAAAVAALVLLLVWVYARTTGSMRELSVQLDEFANSVRELAIHQVWNLYGQNAVASSMGLNTDSNKSK
ncbi:atlastin [Plutella xylostella]|uniref:atlastin n=1 Tax=Plutella xylostella TaxID=51655 RepID=UPI002032B807|nr:atlastin [Plutella xylostella]